MPTQKNRQEIIDALTNCGTLSYGEMVNLLYSIAFLNEIEGGSFDGFISKFTGEWNAQSALAGKYDADYYAVRNSVIYKSTVQNNKETPGNSGAWTPISSQGASMSQLDPTPVANGGTLPASTTPKWMFVGAGTFNKPEGGTLTTTGQFNVIATDGATYRVLLETSVNLFPYLLKSDYTNNPYAYYGPYNTLDLAKAGVPLDIVTNGVNLRTGKIVGVKTSTGITDYWWPLGGENTDLVEYLGDAYANATGYRIVCLTETKFDPSTGVFTYPALNVYNPLGGTFSIPAGSVTIPGGRLLLLSSTPDVFTPVSDKTNTQGAPGYLIPVPIGGFNFKRSGIVVLGYNYAGIFETKYSLLDPAHWLNINDRGFRNVLVTRQGGLSWNYKTKTLSTTSDMQVTLPSKLRVGVSPFSVVVPENSALLLTADMTGATYIPIDESVKNANVTARVYVDPVFNGGTSKDKSTKGAFALGATYYAFHRAEGEQSVWYGAYPALIPDNYFGAPDNREFRNILMTRQGGLTWNPATKTLVMGSDMQLTLPTKLRLAVPAFSVVVPENSALLLTADPTGATFIPIDESLTTTAVTCGVYVDATFNGAGSKDKSIKGAFVLGACYWAFHRPAGEQTAFYGAYPGMIPDNHFGNSGGTITTTVNKFAQNNTGNNTASIGKFVSRLRSRAVNANNLLTMIFWGDSIFGRLYRAEMPEASNNMFSPPGMYRNNIPRRVLDAFQIPGSNLKYYPIKNMTGFITQDASPTDTPVSFPGDNSFVTLTGTWLEFQNYDLHYYRKTSTPGSFVEFQLEAGFSRASLIAQRSNDSANIIDAMVSVNGGAYQTISSAGITGLGQFGLQEVAGTYTNKWQRQYRVEYSGLNTANTYKFKFTHSGVNTFWVWGMEAWGTPSLRVINSARGAHTMGDLKAFLLDDVITPNYAPDVLVLELPMLNDSFSVTTPTFAKDLITMQNLDEVLGKIAETGLEVLIMIPHPSATAPAWYINYIQFARTYASKYGFHCIDMYQKWIDGGLDGRADGTHLNATGVTEWFTEISKVLLAGDGFGSTSKSPVKPQTGTGQAGTAVVFNTPFLTVPRIHITPIKQNGVVPSGQYVDVFSSTGFTAQGTGFFNWTATV